MSSKCLLVAVIVSVTDASRETSRAAYEQFRSKYGRRFQGSSGEVSYTERHARFVKYKTAVEQHNRQPGRSWDAVVNEFADFTDEELRSRLGYVASSWRNSQSTASSSFLETRPVRTLAESVDWTTNSKVKRSSRFLRNQGGCGSCWAVAAAGALEMHAEAASNTTDELSFEQLVDCTPNPEHCGGTGGCKGATAELAFQYVKDHGLGLANRYTGYVTNGKEGPCKHPKEGDRSVKIDGFVTLPVNKLRPLMEALQDKGPAVVSVAAEGWSMYGKGVFDGCSRDATVNHAVLLTGYGKDEGKNGRSYWLIRNSWGSGWGEAGHIRLERHASDEGDDGYCGTDKDPQQGVGCDEGPASLPICGMCGVLSDSSYPKGVRIVGEVES